MFHLAACMHVVCDAQLELSMPCAQPMCISAHKQLGIASAEL